MRNKEVSGWRRAGGHRSPEINEGSVVRKKEGRLEPENFMVESSAIIVVIVITIIVIQWGQLSSPAPSALAASPLERSTRGQW